MSLLGLLSKLFSRGRKADVTQEEFELAELNSTRRKPRASVKKCKAPMIRVSWYEHDFGRHFPGGFVDRDLIISSIGTGDLTLAGVNLPGPHFTIANQGAYATVLPPNSDTTVSIRCAPSSVGRHHDVITITSDAENEDPVTIEVHATRLGTITIVLRDEVSGDPVRDAHLTIRQAGKPATRYPVDQDGKLELETDCAGDVEIQLGEHASLWQQSSLTST
jgi:hypothetical protein